MTSHPPTKAWEGENPPLRKVKTDSIEQMVKLWRSGFEKLWTDWTPEERAAYNEIEEYSKIELLEEVLLLRRINASLGSVLDGRTSCNIGRNFDSSEMFK